jgi:GPH family glycoside/pentoside/hexuronide:cation symporter
MLFPISASFAALGILFWSMLPDTIEYGQWRSGFRAESVFFGVATFTQKMAIGIAGWMLGGLLSVVGFVPAAEQPPVAVTAMKAGMTLAPAALMFLALLIVLRYPLDAKLHQRIRQELGGEDETGR